jgi:hypothetical protein
MIDRTEAMANDNIIDMAYVGPLHKMQKEMQNNINIASTRGNGIGIAFCAFDQPLAYGKELGCDNEKDPRGE